MSAPRTLAIASSWLRLVASAALCGVLAVSGCTSFVPQPAPEPAGAGNYVELTLPIIAMGDTQEHEATGFPLHDNDSAIDSFVEVTQRPPEQPLFGRRLPEWVLQQHPDDPWLHLGDLMDMSCRSEAQRMGKIFAAAGRSGAVLPGNHDGLMFGIYSHNIFDAMRDPEAKKWNLACRRGGAGSGAPGGDALGKRDFILLYLARQSYGAQAASGLKAPAPGEATRISWRNPDPQAFLSGVEANLRDGLRYADSFIAQRLRLPAAPGATRRVILIGLDTNQAGALASAWDTLLGNSPGSIGHVRQDQLLAVANWVQQAARNGDIVVFAGHHNWLSLSPRSRLELGGLMAQLEHPLVYVSAHTHRGFWAQHRTLQGRPLLELNVSSLSDWPIAYRRIRFAYDEGAKRLRVHADLMPRGGTAVTSDAELLAAWTAQTCQRTGFTVDYLRTIDAGLVKQQRASRGSLAQWMREALGQCPECEVDRYEHAQAYQNQMLGVLLETALDLGPAAAGLALLPLPSWCGAGNYVACANALINTQAATRDEEIELFRRKAQLVDLLGTHLDDMDDARAKAYMSCRAVLAAKADFDATDDGYNENRGEAKRRAERFFDNEASVGMK
jgi:hypothetical protein